MIEQLLQADRLLKVDQVEKAETIYGSIRELDPVNAIAIVGLARCALARGDDRRAHELASEALQIDAEDDMARRMEARLAEILAMRGEQVSRPALAATPTRRQMRPIVTSAIDNTPVPGPATGGDRAAVPGPATASNRASVPGAAAVRKPQRRGLFARLIGR